MRVVQVADGAIEVRWMWLPVFIGQNHLLLKDMQAAWKEKFPEGVRSDNIGLDELHNFTIEWLCEQFPMVGLKDYLKAIELVEE